MELRTRIRTTDDVVTRWGERIDMRNPEREDFSRYSMICHSDAIFHYGLHFELARILRTKSGVARTVLLNGDSWNGSGGWGPSTGSRQSDVRNEANRHGAQTVVLPFSALDAAGANLDTIQPIHVRDDWHTTEHGQSAVRPAQLTTMECPDGRTKTEQRWDYRANDYRDEEVPVRVENPKRTRPFWAEHGWCEHGAELGEDGIWRWSWQRHWLGDSLFRARVTERRTRKARPEELEGFERYRVWENEHARLTGEAKELRHESFRLEPARRTFDGNYRGMFRAHFAAAGLRERAQRIERAISDHYQTQPPLSNVRNGRVGITVTRWATFLSSFDYQESRPLYFLCELPHGAKAETVEEAIEALKPPEVIAAEARGLTVTRQGDLFAIPTRLNRRQLRRIRGRGRDFTKRLRVLGTNHSVTEGVICKGGAVLGRGIMRHEPDAFRPPDHAKQYLGDQKTWHLLVRNTVPRTAI